MGLPSFTSFLHQNAPRAALHTKVQIKNDTAPLATFDSVLVDFNNLAGSWVTNEDISHLLTTLLGGGAGCRCTGAVYVVADGAANLHKGGNRPKRFPSNTSKKVLSVAAQLAATGCAPKVVAVDGSSPGESDSKITQLLRSLTTDEHSGTALVITNDSDLIVSCICQPFSKSLCIMMQPPDKESANTSNEVCLVPMTVLAECLLPSVPNTAPTAEKALQRLEFATIAYFVLGNDYCPSLFCAEWEGIGQCNVLKSVLACYSKLREKGKRLLKLMITKEEVRLSLVMETFLVLWRNQIPQKNKPVNAEVRGKVLDLGRCVLHSVLHTWVGSTPTDEAADWSYKFIDVPTVAQIDEVLLSTEEISVTLPQSSIQCIIPGREFANQSSNLVSKAPRMGVTRQYTVPALPGFRDLEKIYQGTKPLVINAKLASSYTFGSVSRHNWHALPTACTTTAPALAVRSKFAASFDDVEFNVEMAKEEVLSLQQQKVATKEAKAKRKMKPKEVEDGKATTESAVKGKSDTRAEPVAKSRKEVKVAKVVKQEKQKQAAPTANIAKTDLKKVGSDRRPTVTEPPTKKKKVIDPKIKALDELFEKEDRVDVDDHLFESWISQAGHLSKMAFK